MPGSDNCPWKAGCCKSQARAQTGSCVRALLGHAYRLVSSASGCIQTEHVIYNISPKGLKIQFAKTLCIKLRGEITLGGMADTSQSFSPSMLFSTSHICLTACKEEDHSFFPAGCVVLLTELPGQFSPNLLGWSEGRGDGRFSVSLAVSIVISSVLKLKTCTEAAHERRR